jgi:hypothetical protein
VEKNPVWNLSLNRLLSNGRVVAAFRRATRRGSTIIGFLKTRYLEEDVDRRSFVTSLFGGLAAASLGGTAIAQAASRKPDLAGALPAGDQIDAATKAALDEADADFNQVRVQIGPRRRRRPPIVRRRVIVRRPPRRRRVITRRVIVR